MFRRRFLFAFGITLCSLSLCAQTGWEYHTRAGEWAFAENDYGKAEQSFRTALKTAQSFSAGDPRIERSYFNLARLLEHQTRLDEAQPYFVLLLAAQEYRVGKSHPDLLETLAGLGRVALGAGDIPVADANLRRYVTIAEATGEADPTQERGVLSLLVRMATLAEKHDEALFFQRRITELASKDKMLLPSEQADLIDKQLEMELLFGTTDKVMPLIGRAARLRSQEGGTSEAMTWAHSAAAALGAAEPELAEKAALRALELEPDDEARLVALTALGDASWLRVRRSHQGMDELVAIAADGESLQEADERITLLLKALEAADLERAEATARLAQIKTMRGLFAEAVKLQEKTVALRQPAGGKQLVTALEDLSVLQQAAGTLDRAASTNRQLIGLIESTEGADAASLVPVLERQLEVLTQSKQKKEARAIKKWLRKLQRKLR
jgi:tetratricopeptide (TPR) repeat protein